MKKCQFILFCIVLLMLFGGNLYAQTTRRNQQQAPKEEPGALTLDGAIEAGAVRITDRLNPTGNEMLKIKVVVLNFRSDSTRLSNYVLDEMMMYLVNSDKVTVVDRANLELIQQEMQFQMSGEVSDSSAQAIGQKLGAQSIVSGSIDDMGDVFRIRFKTINVETAVIQVQSAHDVQKNAQINTLMGTQSKPAQPAATTTTTTTTTTAPSSQPAARPAPAPAARPTTAYSTGRKMGAGILNLGFGLGSITMGDFFGFVVVGGLDLAGWICIVSGLGKATVANNDTYYDVQYNYVDYSQYESEMTSAKVTFYIGAGCLAAGVLYGFIRPYTWDKEVSKKRGYRTEENPMNNITIAPVFSKDSMPGLSLLYSKSF